MSKTKILITVILVGVVAVLAVWQVQNKQLVQGAIFGDKTDGTTTDATLLPDLKATLTQETRDAKGNLRVRIKLENLGDGAISSDNPYSYSIFVNDQLVMRNSDAFSAMAKGDSFSFVYPIDKATYAYPATGKVKVVVDEENLIQETDKVNNTSEISYKL